MLIAVVTAACIVAGGARLAGAAGGPTFWKVDLHQHSAFSGDARADLALDATIDKTRGYNAVFITDHDRGSGFQIQGANGNILTFSDGLSGRWMQKSFPTSLPSGSSVTNDPSATTQVHGGSTSLHLAATASTSTNVRTIIYAKRGMGLNSGDVMLDFWVYPQTIDPNSGVDVSVSIGGDASTGVATYGYTTTDGTSTPGKSTILMWMIGSPPVPSQNSGARVVQNTLGYTTGTWNHYVIDVTTGAVQWTPSGGSTSSSSTTGINGLGSDAPVNYAVIGYPKVEASAVNGTADAYFDDYTQSVTAPTCPSVEFAYRNQLIDSGQFNTSTFKLFPAREMGQNNHSNQFNFDITSASQYKDTYADNTQDDNALCSSTNQASAPPPTWQFSYYGTDNIPAVQATGYPAQDNHPGITDTTADVITNKAYGADTVEVRTAYDYSATWDAILQQNWPIVGTYGSDDHDGVGTGAPATYIDAPALTLDALMHSLFEGRAFMAPNNFGGQIIFNLDGSASPYPSRYPVYVPLTQTSASVHLAITGGLTAGQHVVWIWSNGGAATQTRTVDVTGATYDETASIPLSGAFTYVRAEVTDAAGNQVANTEPIFFEGVSNLPAGTSARVDSITPPSGTCSCTVAMTKGLTSVTYGGSALSLTLTNPASSVSELRIATAQAPTGVSVDTSPVSAAGSLSAYQSGTSSAWYYDSANDLLYLRDAQATGTSQVSVRFGSSSDTTKPTVPQNLAATAAGSSEVDLTWSASTDSGGSGLAGYRIYRNGGSTPVATVGAGATSVADTGLSASTAYSYRVSAFDNAGNESAQSTAAHATTAAASGGGGGGGGGGSGGGGSGGGGSTGSPPPPSPPVPAPPSPAPPAPTPIDCTLAGKAPSSWVRRQVVLTVQTNAAAGNRAEAIVHSGKVVAAGVVASSRVRLSVDTRRMPNGYSKVVAFVYSDGARACMVRSGLKVDNRAPSLLVVRVVPRGSRNVLLVRPSEAVRVTLTSASRTVASLRIGSRRQVALRLPAVRGTGTLTLVDRAGNRVSRRVSWR